MEAGSKPSTRRIPYLRRVYADPFDGSQQGRQGPGIQRDAAQNLGRRVIVSLQYIYRLQSKNIGTPLWPRYLPFSYPWTFRVGKATWLKAQPFFQARTQASGALQPTRS